jgi:hypothetical protein
MELNTIELLDTYDPDILNLDISVKNISGILDLSKFTCLKSLRCNHNTITNIINIPNTLEKLLCNTNQITQLDNLPESLIILNCDLNRITSLDNLPSKIEFLTKKYFKVNLL